MSWWTRLLEFLELSTPEARKVLWAVLGAFLVIGAPLVLPEVLGLSTSLRKLFALLGVAVVVLSFTALILYLGHRHGEAVKMSRTKTWTLAALVLGMGLAGGAGIWFGEH